MERTRESRQRHQFSFYELSQSTLIKVVLLALLYYFSGKLSFAIFSQSKIITITTFLPEGFALAAVLLYGPWVIPGIFLGQLLLAIDTGLGTLPSFGIALGSSAEAGLAFWLARRFRLDIRLGTVRDILLLGGMILFVLQPFSSLIGNTVMYLTHAVTSGTFIDNFENWWFGNAMGQLLLTPFLLYLHDEYRTIRISSLLLIMALTIALNYLFQIVFGFKSLSLLMLASLPILIHLSTVYLTYALGAVIALSLSTVAMVHYKAGVFVHGNDLSLNLTNLNCYILSLVFMTMIIGTLFREKNRTIEAARHDPLTGLFNRTHLKERLQQSLQFVQKEGTISALCYIDLDRFKEVNDTYGHRAGDIVLLETVRRIQKHMREDDDLIRQGGDEFLLIFNHIHDRKEIKRVLDRITEEINRPIDADGQRCHLTASIGVVILPRRTAAIETVLQHADETMYQAKHAGRNRYLINELSAD